MMPRESESLSLILFLLLFLTDMQEHKRDLFTLQKKQISQPMLRLANTKNR